MALTRNMIGNISETTYGRFFFYDTMFYNDTMTVKSRGYKKEEEEGRKKKKR